MRKLLIKIKKEIKRSTKLTVVIRYMYGLLPLLFKEKVSNFTQNPFSKVEVENGIIFVHVPKCAGNSIMMSLFEVKGQGHNKLSDYYLFDKDLFDKSYKFSIVRDPVTRFYSAYSYLMKGGMGNYDIEFRDRFLNGFSDIDQFVKELNLDENLRLRVFSWTHFIPQSKFYEINGRNSLDYLICYDELEKGYETVCVKLGLSSSKKALMKVNVTGGDKSISENVKLFVEMHYKKDLEYYENSKTTIC